MKATMILAKDIVTSVIEGAPGMMDRLRQDAENHELMLIQSCVIEGLGRASSPTAAGLRDLAELISIARFQLTNRRQNAAVADGPQAQMTPDALLSALLGKIKASTIAQMAKQVRIVISDAFIVAALLSVADGDELYPENLAEVLQAISIQLCDHTQTVRESWHKQLSSRSIAMIREKARCAP